MGLKGAASYFQQMMEHVVLVGLSYISLEVYLDDIIVHGRTEDELITRLQEVFERLDKHNITLKPGKCIFGAEEIQYVGHISGKSQGTTFSREKLDEVINYRDLITQQDLKQ
jgi:molybdopterin-biosynthesis enzyme MoeA-like protein